MRVKSRSASSASDISVVLISCQPRSSGPAMSIRERTSSRIRQGWLKKHVQKTRWESRIDCASGPKPTAATPAASVKATRSGGTAMHTSCPRSTNSRPTTRLGSTSPRLPQLANTNFIAAQPTSRQSSDVSAGGIELSQAGDFEADRLPLSSGTEHEQDVAYRCAEPESPEPSGE